MHANAQTLLGLLGPAVAGLVGCSAVVAACGFDGEGRAERVAAAEDATFTDSPAAALDATDAPSALDDGSEICAADIATDPSNCGRCSHSCLGGSCVAGRCQPATLATRGRPHELTVDATEVYWSDKGTGSIAPTVARCAKSGSAVVVLATAAVGNADPSSLAILGTRLLFTDVAFNTVVSCALPACSDVQTSGESGPEGIASNGTRVFWANRNSGIIRGSDAQLSSQQTIVQNQTGVGRIAASATSLFFTVTNGVVKTSVAGSAGGSFSNGVVPRDLAIDATSVYLADATQIVRLTLALGSAMVVATGLDIQRVAVDGSGIYFTDRGGATGRILRCPPAGCVAPVEPEVLATGEIMPFGIALDATHVYWTNEAATAGTIRRVAK